MDTKKPAQKPQPFKRNWLKEAYMIAKGMDIPPKKEHIQHVVNEIIAIRMEANKLRNVMMKAYDEACKRRKERGEPIPPPPPSLLPPEGKN
jgi:hypothetical protein